MAGGTGDVPLVAPEGAVLAGAGCEEKLEEVFDKLGNLRRCKHGSLFPVPSYSQPCCLCLAQGRGYFGKVHGDVVNPQNTISMGTTGRKVPDTDPFQQSSSTACSPSPRSISGAIHRR